MGFALGHGQHLPGMATQMVVVHFLLFSTRATANIFLVARGLAPVRLRSSRKSVVRGESGKLRYFFLGPLRNPTGASPLATKKTIHVTRHLRPSILLPGPHCNACKTGWSQAVPQAVQSVTRTVPKASQAPPARPTKNSQGLDLPDLHGTGPPLALRLYQAHMRASLISTKARRNHHALRSPRY
ncbi:hypothetical protein D3C84_736450 [compost metagenome]